MNTAFMDEAITLARKGMEGNHGGPFGAVIVKDNQIIGRGFNQVVSKKDATAHAELIAIRQACDHLQNFSLSGCEIYTACEPCSMCLGAIYWARIEKIYYTVSRTDVTAIGFDDDHFYKETCKDIKDRMMSMALIENDAVKILFKDWQNKLDKVKY